MSNIKNKNRFPFDRNGMQGTNAPWLFLYGFFLLHMMMFGMAGFLLAYSSQADFVSNLMFSGFAIFVYIIFYLVIFGIDEIKWLIINSAIGILGIISQLDWILERFGTSYSDYQAHIHIIPAIYYVLYTFLLRRAVLHLLRAKDGTRKKLFIDIGYVVFSVGFYFWSLT